MTRISASRRVARSRCSRRVFAQRPHAAQRSRGSPLDRSVIPTPGKDAGASRSDVDEADACQRRAARRVGATWAAARLVADQLHRRRATSTSRPTRPGLASFVAADADRGHDARAPAIRSRTICSCSARAFGASVDRRESGRMAFVSTSDKFAPTLALLADVLVNPTFPQDGARSAARAHTGRPHAERRIARARSPASSSRRCCIRRDHPYGRSTTEASVKAITRDDLVAFHSLFPARPRRDHGRRRREAPTT